jgi:putative Mn2+ efflux pump MntP
MHLLTIILLGISSNLDTLGVGIAYGTRKYRLPFLSNLVCALIPSAGTCLMMIIGEALRNVITDPLANVLGAVIVMAAGAVLIVQHGKPRPSQAPCPRSAGCCAAPGAACSPLSVRAGRSPSSPHSFRPDDSPDAADAAEDIPSRNTLLSSMKDLGKILEDPFRADYDYSGSIEIGEALVLALALALNNLANGLAAGLMGLNIFLTAVIATAVSLIFFSGGINIGLRFIGRWIGERGDLAAGLILILLGICELLG